MNDIKYLVGKEEICNRPLDPYSDEAIAFISALSNALMKDVSAKGMPDVMSFAFWCRKGNVTKLKNEFMQNPSAAFRLGRGLAFHVAPSNIPVNFAFSFVFSLLAGNANIVRVPSKPFIQTQVICSAINSIIDEYPEIKCRTMFVTYPINDEITAHFCSLADARIIWGGDSTIADVKKHQAMPRCIDIAFADRYSLCVIDGEAIKRTDEKELAKLAERFYNDTYLMDQNACSSPQLMLWRNDDNSSRGRFWSAVSKFTAGRYILQAATAVEKYTHLCEDAIEIPEVSRIDRGDGNLVYRAFLEKLPDVTRATCMRGKGGYFYEYSISDWQELIPLVTERYQTITYYGVSPDEIQKMVIENKLRGIDRIVPIGDAMDIGVIWDGYDLISMLSRIISAK
ncbi:MAG: acyl-CoA reductase [Candidatus Fimivivens sp.]|nr:acyl-CoA reductase [Candidatus Fimivivens sp.]